MKPVARTTPKGAVQAKAGSAQGLRDLFENGLKDIYYAEKAQAKSLQKMVQNASSPELVNELKNDLAVTKEQVSRLERVFKASGLKASAKKCEAIDGIIRETNGLLQLTAKGNVRDAGIIASEQKAKHYEIASFGTLHAYAKTLGEHGVADLLATTLDVAKKTDIALTNIAVSAVNKQAWRADAVTNLKKKL
ncbi:MAG: ferritin-like domain-containing protein [Flavobacterium sp.]